MPKYVQSFLSIDDQRVRSFIENEFLERDILWPHALDDPKKFKSSIPSLACQLADTRLLWPTSNQ